MSEPQLQDTPERQANDEPHFLADPDAESAFARMLEEFARETDRGSILIAADIVSAHLAKVIEALAPETFRKKRVKELLNYPGSLATFAARADIAFMAGFIGDTAHRSIDRLRNLRNKAAHSGGAFSLANHRDALRAICDLGPRTATEVNNLALGLIHRSVVSSLLARGVEIEAEIGTNPFRSPSEIFEDLMERPETVKALDERLPRTELAFGVWILLGLISHQQKAISRARDTGRASSPAP